MQSQQAPRRVRLAAEAEERAQLEKKTANPAPALPAAAILSPKVDQPFPNSAKQPSARRQSISDPAVSKVLRHQTSETSTSPLFPNANAAASTAAASASALPPLVVQCQVRTRIPTPHGHVFLHLYKNNHDEKEHLCFIADRAQMDAQPGQPPSSVPHLRSRTLDASWREGETEMERIVRGAYVGRLSASTINPSVPQPSHSASDDSARETPLVRIHSECFTGEVTGSQRCDCGEQLDEAFRLITSLGRGVIVYLRQEGRGIGLLEKLRAYNLQDLGHDTVTANLLLGHGADLRTYDIAGAILRDLDVPDVRLLTNNPDKIEQIEKEGINVIERVAMVPRSWTAPASRRPGKQQQRPRGPVISGAALLARAHRLAGGESSEGELVDFETESDEDLLEPEEDFDYDSDASHNLRQAGVGMIGASVTRSAELDKYLRTKVERMGHLLNVPPTPPSSGAASPVGRRVRRERKEGHRKHPLEKSVASLMTDEGSIECGSGCDECDAEGERCIKLYGAIPGGRGEKSRRRTQIRSGRRANVDSRHHLRPSPESRIIRKDVQIARSEVDNAAATQPLDYSIIRQASDSRLRLDAMSLNADGFGVAWYPSEEGQNVDHTPGIFKSCTPAWSNQNLHRLAEKIESRLVFAHVRASTTGALSEENCHPWRYHSICFQHNGMIADFRKIIRKLQADLSDEFYNFPQGNTDSEWAFACFLERLSKLTDPKGRNIPHAILKKAMLDTIALINSYTAEVNAKDPSLMNFCVTDGVSVVATRYISSRTEEAASLFYSTGSTFEEYQKGGHYRMNKCDKRENIILIASEPLTFESCSVVFAVPRKSITLSGDKPASYIRVEGGAERTFCSKCGSPIMGIPSPSATVAYVKAATQDWSYFDLVAGNLFLDLPCFFQLRTILHALRVSKRPDASEDQRMRREEDTCPSKGVFAAEISIEAATATSAVLRGVFFARNAKTRTLSICYETESIQSQPRGGAGQRKGTILEFDQPVQGTEPRPWSPRPLMLAQQSPITSHAVRRPSSTRSRSSSISPNSRTPSSTQSDSSRSSLSAGTSSSPTTPGAPMKEDINPLYRLSERVEDGEILPIHLYGVRDGHIVARQGPAPSFIHPSTWQEKPLLLTEMGRARSKSGRASSSSEDDGPPDDVKHFHDHAFHSSKRDTLRMNAHDFRADIKEHLKKGKGKGRQQPDVHPDVLNSLARDDETSESEAEDEQEPHSLGHPNAHSSTSYFSTTSNPNGASTSRSGSPSSSHAISITSTPPPADDSTRDRTRDTITQAPKVCLTESPEQAPYSDEAEPSSLPAPIPALQTPQQQTAQSSSPPTQAALRSSPLNSLLPPPSFSGSPESLSRIPSPMRRANTTGSPLQPSSSRQSSPSSRLGSIPQRTQSYSQPQQRSYSLGHDGHGLAIDGIGESGVDDVDASIAAQAEVIKRERMEKRLEKEREMQETVKTGSTPGDAPMLKRRSTRAGSGSEGPGTGVLVGNLIGQDHANYVLMYNMLTGIRIAVSRCQAKLKRPLTDADYTARHKFSFDIVGNELTPSTKYDFKFKDYAPWVFRELREYFYLDPSDYLVSLTAKYILSELGSPGKSGSFFYFSRDYRFIIKTIRHSEHKFLRSILKEYYEYIKSNPHTLLSRFYGLHRVKLPHGKKIHFVIMNNLFPPHRDIHESYDLKGSAIGRITPEEKWKANPSAILKDLNWVNRNRQIALGPEKKALFEEQLRRDTELMQKLGIMDYSLLTGIHNTTRGNTDNLRDGMLTVFQPETVKVRRRQPTQVKRDADASALRQAIQRSDPKALNEGNKLPEADTSERQRFLFYQDEGGIRATGDDNEDLGVIYYLGIIDILTPYGTLKKIEHFFKGMQHDKHMISAVPPKEYGDRFLAFIRSVVRGNDPSTRPRMFEGDPGGKGKGKAVDPEKMKAE
ncbi:1-phosphatidylinositol-4-phosphate 5-kinase, partial [Phenoliferia sp. Uapishka_3]